MFFVIVGVLLIVLNLAGIGPIALWNWEFSGDLWKFTVPFILAALWWWWSDATGVNKRREMNKMAAKKQKRREENLQALGMSPRKSRKR